MLQDEALCPVSEPVDEEVENESAAQVFDGDSSPGLAGSHGGNPLVCPSGDLTPSLDRLAPRWIRDRRGHYSDCHCSRLRQGRRGRGPPGGGHAAIQRGSA